MADPCCTKQWGDWAPHDNGGKWSAAVTNQSGSMYHIGKRHAGRELDGRTWDEYPQAVGS